MNGVVGIADFTITLIFRYSCPQGKSAKASTPVPRSEQPREWVHSSHASRLLGLTEGCVTVLIQLSSHNSSHNCLQRTVHCPHHCEVPLDDTHSVGTFNQFDQGTDACGSICRRRSQRVRDRITRVGQGTHKSWLHSPIQSAQQSTLVLLCCDRPFSIFYHSLCL
jgi:hypothetical protein